jgi:hypothetical protein
VRGHGQHTRLRIAAVLLAAVLAPAGDDEALVLRVRVLDQRDKERADATAEVRDATGNVLARGDWDRASGACDVAVPVAKLRAMGFGPIVVAATAPGCAERWLSTYAAEQVVTLRIPGARRVSGTVRTAAGDAIAGAEIAVVAYAGSRCTPPRVRARSDEAGRFSLPDAGGDASSVYVWHPLFLGVTARVPHSGEVDVVLEPEKTSLVKGSVTHAGEPVAGARVHTPNRQIATTDESGRYEIRVFREGRSLGAAGFRPGDGLLVAEAPGFEITALPIEGEAPVDVDLRRVPPLRGTVAGDQGPLAGCEVSLFAVRGGTWTAPLRSSPLSTRADGNGRFAFDAVPEPPLGLLVTAQGHLPRWLELDAQPVQAVDVRLERGGTVAGTVCDVNGAPLAGARIVALTPPGKASYVGGQPSAFTDERGRFLVTGCPTGTPFPVFAARGDLRSATRSVTCDDAQPVHVELRAADRLPIPGVVRDDAGNPVAHARVVARPPDGRPALEALTSSEGRFELADLPLGQYELLVTADGHVQVRTWVSAGETATVDACRLRGDGVLLLEVAGAPPGEIATVDLVHVFVRAVHRREEAAIAEGGIRIAELPRGPYALEVVVPGFEPARVDGVRVGSEPFRAQVRLERGRPLRVLAQPEAEIAITTLRGREAPGRARADAEGVAAVYGVGPGLYRIVARRPGCLVAFAELEVRAEPPAEGLNLRAGAAARVVVTVLDADGRPAPGARLWLATPERWELPLAEETDAQGQATLREVIGGDLAVVARAGDGLRGEATVTVRAGADHAVTVRLAPESAISESD